MKALLSLAFALSLILSTLAARGEDTPVKFKSTGEGDSTLSTGYSPSDPLQGKPVDKGSDAGHPLTQQPYDENCKDDRCIRAEQRQTGTTTWQEDRASGLSKSGTTTTPATTSTTTTTTTEPAPSK